MKNDVQKWVEKEGEEFLESIGIKKGQIVLDFGAGEGHYAIPAAKVVGKKGKVYAFDKDKSALDSLRQMAIQENIENIRVIQGDMHVVLEDNFVDAVLCYDMIHYIKKRKAIYNEICRILKPGGIFSLYPKHYKDDYPLMELADVELKNIIKEVEKSGFVLKDRITKECLHDDYYNECQIFNFKKSGC